MEWVSIIVHDWGDWGCEDMDGKSGKGHPVKGANIACRLARVYYSGSPNCETFARYWWAFCAGHSKSFVRSLEMRPSRLYEADKVACLMEPVWFYRLRAWLSGEGKEFTENSPMRGASQKSWFLWYRKKVASEHLLSSDTWDTL